MVFINWNGKGVNRIKHLKTKGVLENVQEKAGQLMQGSINQSGFNDPHRK